MLTGGYLYNGRIASLEPRTIRYTVGSPDELAEYARHTAHARSKSPILAIDSLFVQYPQTCREVLSLPFGKRIALIHYLQSADPTVPSASANSSYDAEDFVLGSVDRVITTSRYLARVIAQRGVPGSRIHVCPPGVTPALRSIRRRHRTADPTELLTVANFSPLKAQADLLPVLAKLRAGSWRWTIVGDPVFDAAYSRRFSAEVRRLGLERSIVTAGACAPETLIDFYSDADLFVSTSRFESYGMACAEAIAAGVPVIANHSGGVTEVVRHGVTGFLCRRGDAAAWHNNLLRLVTHREALRRLTANAVRARAGARAWTDAARQFIRQALS